MRSRGRRGVHRGERLQLPGGHGARREQRKVFTGREGDPSKLHRARAMQRNVPELAVRRSKVSLPADVSLRVRGATMFRRQRTGRHLRQHVRVLSSRQRERKRDGESGEVLAERVHVR